MIRRREREREKKNGFSLIISLELLINQSVWGWSGVHSVTVEPKWSGKATPACKSSKNYEKQ